jgi:Kef-type K+ transport system membrane component KefB
MTDAELARLFLALVLLLSAALAGGHLCERVGLPRVIGEIGGGLIVGPSGLGVVAPGAEAWLFRGFETQSALLSTFYWLGLILLMFTAGFRVRPELPAAERRLVVWLVASSVLLQFPFGFLAAPAFASGRAGDPLAFAIVLGIAVAVTSIPVISRIFIDLGAMDSGFARVVLAAASVQDLLLWIALAVATGLQQGTTGGVDKLQVAAITVAFALFSVALGPPLLRHAGRMTGGKFTEASLTGYTLLVCLIFVAMASLIGVNVIFGALLAGLIIGRFPAAAFGPVKQRISDISLWFFVPIYFALVGHSLNLARDADASLILGFLLASSAAKLASVMAAARAAGSNFRHALDLGMAMNTRGGPGIVLASVAHAAGIVDGRMFLALLLASVLTAVAAGWWFRRRRAEGWPA